MTTPYGAPEWAASQAAPDVTVNEALRRTQSGAGLFPVADKDLTTAPGSCADGATYIVATAGGAWSTGAAKDLATAVGINAANGWLFKTPVEGCFAYAQDENALYYYSGSAWTAFTAGGVGGLLAANNLSDVANAGTARTNLGLAIGTDVQAYDPDLTALAALSGTNTIYYRSAANTWSAVTVSTGLSFSGGNLTATGVASGAITSSGLTMTTARLLGRTTASTGAVEEITAGKGLSLASGALNAVPRVSSGASSSSPMAWNSDTHDQINLTALANALTISADSGTPVDGQKAIFRLKDNGSARALTWTTGAKGFRAIGVTLPTTTVLSKIVYVGCIYHATDDRWDAVAVSQEI